MRGATLILALFGVLAAGDAAAVLGQETGKSGAAFDPPLPRVGAAPELPDITLGVALLSSLEMLAGGIGSTHALWRRLNETGSDESMSFTNVVRAPNGTAQRQVFTRFTDLDLYVRKITAARQAYTEEINRRGYLSLVSAYVIDAAADCSPDWFGDGRVIVHRAGAVFELWQGQKGFMGATVGDTVVIIFQKGLRPPLIGRGGADIRLIEAGGTCQMTLVPGE